MQEPIYNNGTVKVAKEGVSAYLAWYRTLSMADAKEISDVCSRLTKEAAKNAGVDLYDIGRNTFSFFGHQTEENWEKQRASVSEKMLQFFHFAEEFEQPIRAALWSKEAAFLYIGNPQKGIIVMEPEKYMTYTPDRDYSDLTPAQAMAELGSAAVCDMSIIPVGAGTALSQKTVKEQLSTHQTEIEKLKSEMKDVEGAKTGELAELTAQIEALKQELWQKKDKLMAELNRKMEEMEEKKEQLEGQIYLLDSQIYAIRCYAGEVVNFTRIRSGKNAPDTEPIVVHQKLRFLDEDLGRLASLYEMSWICLRASSSTLHTRWTPSHRTNAASCSCASAAPENPSDAQWTMRADRTTICSTATTTTTARPLALSSETVKISTLAGRMKTASISVTT